MPIKADRETKIFKDALFKRLADRQREFADAKSYTHEASAGLKWKFMILW